MLKKAVIPTSCDPGDEIPRVIPTSCVVSPSDSLGPRKFSAIFQSGAGDMPRHRLEMARCPYGNIVQSMSVTLRFQQLTSV